MNEDARAVNESVTLRSDDRMNEAETAAMPARQKGIMRAKNRATQRSERRDAHRCRVFLPAQ